MSGSGGYKILPYARRAITRRAGFYTLPIRRITRRAGFYTLPIRRITRRAGFYTLPIRFRRHGVNPFATFNREEKVYMVRHDAVCVYCDTGFHRNVPQNRNDQLAEMVVVEDALTIVDTDGDRTRTGAVIHRVETDWYPLWEHTESDGRV